MEKVKYDFILDPNLSYFFLRKTEPNYLWIDAESKEVLLKDLGGSRF